MCIIGYRASYIDSRLPNYRSKCVKNCKCEVIVAVNKNSLINEGNYDLKMCYLLLNASFNGGSWLLSRFFSLSKAVYFSILFFIFFTHISGVRCSGCESVCVCAFFLPSTACVCVRPCREVLAIVSSDVTCCPTVPYVLWFPASRPRCCCLYRSQQSLLPWFFCRMLQRKNCPCSVALEAANVARCWGASTAMLFAASFSVPRESP